MLVRFVTMQRLRLLMWSQVLSLIPLNLRLKPSICSYNDLKSLFHNFVCDVVFVLFSQYILDTRNSIVVMFGRWTTFELSMCFCFVYLLGGFVEGTRDFGLWDIVNLSCASIRYRVTGVIMIYIGK
ncbi:beta-crystallin S [Striga asiatica]|uniref:Beta-crystallin S n=1 Tax=Striga asiatica TaxID=4170 RepID=A0A5A7PCJ8_STRAF|nr:beta-crystallin S [Striga asiatica]